MCKLNFLLVFLFINSAVSSFKNAKIFFFYKESNGATSKSVYNLDDAVLVRSHPKFDLTKRTMLYSHGYIDSAEGEKAQLIVNAYNKNGRYNILLLDWRELAAEFYPFVVFDLQTLGKEVATQILLMGILGRLHFVGHSLGGQLGGLVGKEIISQSGGTKKLIRISALDPAGPGFVSIGELTKRLTKNDAEFVDVIHTNAGGFGYPDNTGTVDFYPNGGRTQPGCDTDAESCAHQRAVYLWAESVEKGSAVSFLSNNPNGGPRIQMGNNCPLSATGTYYLATAGTYPYSLP